MGLVWHSKQEIIEEYKKVLNNPKEFAKYVTVKPKIKIMKLIKPSVEILEQSSGLDDIYKQIEIAGRTCYKSEKNITEDSAKGFVDRMIKSGHGAMLEHGTVYLHLPANSYGNEIHCHYMNNPYSKCNDNDFGEVFITTNYRVIVENSWISDLEYLCDPTEHHEKRVTVKFTTQIAITREANRHRVNSIAESSTRYCNYSKDKFGNEISINVPTFIDESKIDLEYPSFRGLCHCIYDEEDDVIFSDITYWIFANLACEYAYMNLIRLGWKPEQARTVLPLDTNSELVHTAFVSDWEHFFSLRCHKSAHQDIRALAEPLKDEFIKRNLI